MFKTEKLCRTTILHKEMPFRFIFFLSTMWGHQKGSHIEDRKYRNFIRLSTAATFRTEGEEVGSVAEVKGMMLGKWKKHPDAPDKYARCTARS